MYWLVQILYGLAGFSAIMSVVISISGIISNTKPEGPFLWIGNTFYGLTFLLFGIAILLPSG